MQFRLDWKALCAKDELERLIVLYLPLQCWDYRPEPYSVYTALEITLRVSSMLDKHSCNRAAPLTQC